MEIRAPLKRGLLNGLSITFMMVKVIVPCYIAIELTKYLGVIDTVGSICRPFMRFFGLPGEAALALVAGYLINMYAAIAVITPLHLAAKEITVIALMLGICHSVTVETPVTKRTVVAAFSLLLVRLFLSLIAGAALHMLWTLF